MKLAKISDIFHVEYGNSLELNKLTVDMEGVNFISRTAKNNGVSAKVQVIDSIAPSPANTITVALGGSVLSTFLQPKPFYTGYHIFCLISKYSMTDEEKLFYCYCIESNKFRYNYGRQANRTLKDLLIPNINEIPTWVKDVSLTKFNGVEKPAISDNIKIDMDDFKLVKVQDIFEVVYGVNLELNKLEQEPNGINFVSRTAKNNGVSAKVKVIDKVKPNPKNVLSVAGGGSVLETFLQEEPFYSGRDLYYLKPKDKMSKEHLLFFSVYIKKNAYRYNYGRQANRTLKDLLIPYPKTKISFEKIAKFIKSLPFSKQI